MPDLGGLPEVEIRTAFRNWPLGDRIASIVFGIVLPLLLGIVSVWLWSMPGAVALGNMEGLLTPVVFAVVFFGAFAHGYFVPHRITLGRNRIQVEKALRKHRMSTGSLANAVTVVYGKRRVHFLQGDSGERVMFGDGIGYQDFERAREWIRRACEANHATYHGDMDPFSASDLLRGGPRG
jgi:hypothetical protein